MIQIQGLSKSYGDKTVLHNMDAVFNKAMVYGIVGRNGAGKTTLFRCLAGLETFAGTIEADLKPLKNHLGYVDAESYFLPKITGEEYLYLLSEARGKKIRNLEERNIFELPLKRYITAYSSGMKKKLAIMAVLLQDNDYFILDEPYNGLDLQSCIVLAEIIKKLKSLNKLVLISSHIFSTLEESCDEILLLEDGHFTVSATREKFPKLKDQLSVALLHKNVDDLFSP